MMRVAHHWRFTISDTAGTYRQIGWHPFAPIVGQGGTQGHEQTPSWYPTVFSEAKWLKDQVKVVKTDPEPFCGFRRLWYTLSYRFSILQGWRHGVRSRSLGGMCRHLP
jgi:hypothetical protein